MTTPKTLGFPLLTLFLSFSMPSAAEPHFTEGTLVSWLPTDSASFHQPESSQDGTTWIQLGPPFLGTDTTTILDPDSAPFHRVIVSGLDESESLINGGFEIADPTAPDCPDDWNCISNSGQNPTRITTDSFAGVASLRIAVQNDDTETANQSEIQQNLGAAGGSITAGETYTFSFQAMQISSGLSYVQSYRLQWFDASGGPILGTEVGFNSFLGGDGIWEEISAPNLIAPAGATGAFIQIFGATGAVAGDNASGEVLIDCVSLSLSNSASADILTTTTEPGLGITMLTQAGVLYRAQQSEDLQTFDDLTGTFTGNGRAVGAGIPDGGPSHFFRILEVSEPQN